MIGYKTDYHIHTTCSDGMLTPVEIVKKYAREGYDIIAITDHDTTGGLQEAQIAAEALGIRVVNGIEFSSICSLRPLHMEGVPATEAELHILGYSFDPENDRMKETCARLKEWRRERNERFLQKLQEMGYPLTKEDLPQKPDNFLGKPDFVRALIRKGYGIKDPWALFDDVPKKRLSETEAIAVIREAGGVSVLAHPFEIDELKPRTDGFYARLSVLAHALKKEGLKGMECFHPSATREESLQLVEIAAELRLHITGGSDFHGDKSHRYEQKRENAYGR